MLLTKIKIENFKCHEELVIPSMKKLAVFIGENDAGKTVILDAIDLLLSGQNCKAEDYRDCATGMSEEIKITGDFILDEDDALPEYLRSSDTHFQITKSCSVSGTRYSVIGEGFEDEKFDNFHNLTVVQQQVLLRSIDITPKRLKDEIHEQFDEFVVKGGLKKKLKSLVVNYADVKPYLPRVERFSSGDYTDPHSIIQRGLKSVALAIIKPQNKDSGEHEELAELLKLRADIAAALNTEITKATATIRSILPDLQSVNILPTIDFSNVLSSVQLEINSGGGKRKSLQYGQGTNRRLWLGLLDWQRQVERENAVSGIIYLYDEPETNLHYRAQQQLFKHISDRSNEYGPVQSVICTHSIHLIDRAPADSIYLLDGNGNDARKVRCIEGDTAENMRAFFERIGRNLGLSNTALLYERAFLVVEGETEDEALPILYNTLYGRSPSEDGIVLVNLFSCGAWPTAMKVLLRNRQEFVHMLLDQDCTEPDSTADLTPARLTEVGCSETFLSEQVTFIGLKEYEDAFSDFVIVKALNAKFERADGDLWTTDEINNLRVEQKFSESLRKRVLDKTVPRLKSKAKKPKIAVAIAEICPSEHVPFAVKAVFSWLRQQAGLEEKVVEDK